MDLADFEDALKNLWSALSEEASIFLESFFFIESPLPALAVFLEACFLWGIAQGC